MENSPSVTPEEKSLLESLSASFQDYKKTQYDFNARVSEQLSSIDRGLYGDPRNNQPGLIHKQNGDEIKFQKVDEHFEKLEERLEKIERQQWKTTVKIGLGAGLLATILSILKTIIFK